MPVAARGNVMKSHFPLVTQQATTELWTQKGNEAPKCKSSLPA